VTVAELELALEVSTPQIVRCYARRKLGSARPRAGLANAFDQAVPMPKLADQMCSMLGGGCKAPLTDQQIADGASKLNASQTTALGDNFGSALNSVTGNPLVKEGVRKAIAPKLGGIVGALL